MSILRDNVNDVTNALLIDARACERHRQTMLKFL